MNNVPLINLANSRRTELVRAVGEASERLGIFFVKAPGIMDIVSPAYTDLRKFFDLPGKRKRRYVRKKLNYQVGWTPSFTEVGLACRRVNRSPNPVEKNRTSRNASL